MSAFQFLAVALAACIGVASADKKEFPLVWVCLGITIAGVIVALYVAYRRPEELHLPGSTVMTATENEGMYGVDSGAQEGMEYPSKGGNVPV